MEALTTFFSELVNDCEESNLQLLLRNDVRIIEECHCKIEDNLRTLNILIVNVTEGILQELLLTLYQMLWDIHTQLENYQQQIEYSAISDSRVCTHTNNGHNGRASSNINEGQMIYLRNKLGLSWTDISKTLKVSRSTVYRLKNKYSMEKNSEYLSDDDLDKILQDILSETPNSGEVYVLGSLRSRNYKVQRWRVRERLNVIDPVNRALRKRKAILRRVYSVKGANYLWHIDSNHKLVNFRMVFHGCIDGYSRLIIYLKCLNNNKASSVLTCFQEGITEFGFPSHVRGDRGTENIGVANLMIGAQGCDRGSFIVGRSVHNQRIERLWSEVNRVVSQHFKNIFLHMEEIGILDENSEIDLFCLSYIFMPRIRRSLEEFVRQWNHHGLSTSGSRSPWQIWTLDAIQGNSYVSSEDPNYEQNPHEYGIDYMGPPPAIQTDNNVVVPQFQLTFSANQLQQICNLIPDPLFDDNCGGLAMYMRLKELIGTLL